MICQDIYSTINLIQGDTLDVQFIIEDLAFTEEVEVFFVCKALGLEVQLLPHNQYKDDSDDDSDDGNTSAGWYLLVKDTTNFRIGEFEYDVTAIEEPSTDPVTTTFVYHGKITVLPRAQKRRLEYNPYYEYPHNTPLHDHEAAAESYDINVVAGVGYNSGDNQGGFGYTED